MRRAVEVLAPGPLALVQDRGRTGLAHLGVPRSGWLDDRAARWANRLVGNDPGAAVVESLLGGLVVRASSAIVIAVTGARCPVTLTRHGRTRAAAYGEPVVLHAGDVLRVGTPVAGLRCYLAVGGGITVDPVLGSRSTCTLSGLGPPALEAGTVLPVGPSRRPAAGPYVEPPPAAPARGPEGETVLRVQRGPRHDWFEASAWSRLVGEEFTVGPSSDRIGVRLAGTVLRRRVASELPSEPVVLGAVQVPTSGEPVIFLADHPTTGGYPVLAVVARADLDACAQLRPGDRVRFVD